MDSYIPNIYKKNIFDINYPMLKQKGIRCLIFDLDNTLLLIDKDTVDDRTLALLKKITNDFIVVVLSNNFKKRISKFCEPINIDFISFALKPFPISFNKIRKKYSLNKEEMCIIGDQIMTDILGGNKYGITTILTDPLGEKDLKVTSVNRYLEKKKLKKLAKLNLLERGKYYE